MTSGNPFTNIYRCLGCKELFELKDLEIIAARDIQIAKLKSELAMRVDDCRIALKQRDEARKDVLECAKELNINSIIEKYKED